MRESVLPVRAVDRVCIGQEEGEEQGSRAGVVRSVLLLERVPLRPPTGTSARLPPPPPVLLRVVLVVLVAVVVVQQMSSSSSTIVVFVDRRQGVSDCCEHPYRPSRPTVPISVLHRHHTIND